MISQGIRRLERGKDFTGVLKVGRVATALPGMRKSAALAPRAAPFLEVEADVALAALAPSLAPFAPTRVVREHRGTALLFNDVVTQPPEDDRDAPLAPPSRLGSTEKKLMLKQNKHLRV